MGGCSVEREEAGFLDSQLAAGSVLSKVEGCALKHHHGCAKHHTLRAACLSPFLSLFSSYRGDLGLDPCPAQDISFLWYVSLYQC